jgi:DNA-binding XRE family transcriptional regulator
VLDPDKSIHDAVQLIFDTFRQTSSATATVKRFRREGWLFPRTIRRGLGKGDLLWGPLDHCRAIQILHNPRYAGAFVYGRTRGGYRVGHKHHTIKVARDDWQVLIREAHPGYIDWDEFERNQVTLTQNARGFGQSSRGSVPREGVGLLQGRVVCGICGARMRVRYQEVEGKLEPYYICTENSVRRADKPCQSIRGRVIDEAIGVLLLDSVAPVAIELTLAVESEIAGRVEQAATQRITQLTRARYDAELARRRYLHVDPANRLVADALEADWNERLRELDLLQQAHDQQQQADQKLLGNEARARIRQLAQDFPRVWNDERVVPLERKRMVALLIEDVTLVKADRIAIHVRFRGGQTSSFEIDKPKSMALIRKTPPEVVRKVDELLAVCTDQEVAEQLNALDFKNWKGESFTPKKIWVIRHAYHLKSRFERLRERGMLTARELAAQLGVCPTTIYQWGHGGVLREHRYGNEHRCLYEPVGNATLIKGQGGRYSSTPPIFMTAPTAKQGAI